MRHQVERLKHVAPKHGVKPVCALTAALAVVAMPRRRRHDGHHGGYLPHSFS